MTRVTILREGEDRQDATYRAVGGHAQAMGRTAGEAVDALAARLPEDQAGLSHHRAATSARIASSRRSSADAWMS